MKINIEFTNHISVCKKLMPKLVAFLKAIKEKQKNESCDFNPFNVFNHNEPAHSRILSFLLDSTESHGQGCLFLHSFLNFLSVYNHAEGFWEVSCETGHVDICLKRNFPLSIIIIENKSNGAGDQPNQLYRYWHKEIYLHHKTEKNLTEFYKKNSSFFKIIYLSHTQPSKHSLQRDSKLEGPDKLPMKPETITFQKIACDWLKKKILDSPEGIHVGNKRMRDYIEKYIEFWTK